MVPTLRDGDLLLVRLGARVTPGDVVLASFPALPGTLVLKRVERREPDGWWLRSDNAFAGGDSTVYGVGHVLGRVVLLVRPGRPWPRVVARARLPDRQD
jgi:phage repressor protein C with HTH and peptisase S24 domain